MLVTQPIIDYIQFTCPVNAGWGRVMGSTGAQKNAREIFADLFLRWGMNRYIVDVLLSKKADVTPAAAPYNVGFRFGDVFVYCHDGSDAVDTVMVQCPGQACVWLRENDALLELLNLVHNRVSRIDIAVDVQTQDELDTLFSTTKDVGVFPSSTGKTYYIGSRNSDKYARVYRYFKPHPRWEYARIECVYRRKFAQEFTRQVLTNGVTQSMADAVKNNRMKLHPEIDGALGDGNFIRVAAPVNRGVENTLLWVIKQVAPAVQRLIREGSIEDPADFFQRYFMPPAADE